MGRIIAIIMLAMIATNSSTAAVMAQSAGKAKSGKESPKPVQTGPVLIAPYDDKLMRLSEVLGSIHYLRQLCNANEGQLWREKMAALIAAEEPRPARKARMISSFNRGYVSFDRTYATCTPAALLAVNRYMKAGVLLTNQITSRYGR